MYLTDTNIVSIMDEPLYALLLGGVAYKVVPMSHPFPFRSGKRNNRSQPIHRKETPWERAWRLSPERMREHVNKLTEARVKKSEETAALVQVVLNLIPADPVAPYKLRDTFRQLWKETYDEDKTNQEAWNLLRLAMRHGKIGKTENGLIYPRHG